MNEIFEYKQINVNQNPPIKFRTSKSRVIHDNNSAILINVDNEYRVWIAKNIVYSNGFSDYFTIIGSDYFTFEIQHKKDNTKNFKTTMNGLKNLLVITNYEKEINKGGLNE